MTTDITIITTTYNSFSKMGKYFECLTGQTDQIFKIIIVDDCSTDNTFSQLTDYIKKSSFKNFKLLKTSTNLGPGGARNFAIGEVDTDYFFFLDSDDYINKNTIETIRPLLQEGYDCLFFDTFVENKRRSRVVRFCNEYGDINLTKVISSTVTGICSKIYRTSIVKNNLIKFPNTFNGEDMAFNLLYYNHCASFFHHKCRFYHYVFQQTSLSNADYIRKANELHKSIDFLRATLKRVNAPALYSVLLREEIYCSLQMMFVNHAPKRDVISYFSKKTGDISTKELGSLSSFYQRTLFWLLKKGRFMMWRFLMGVSIKTNA